MEYVTLSNGVKMPIMGYGVYQVTKDECERCVLDALKAGYRSLDTAQSYFNEEEVGSAIQKSGLQREEIFPLHQNTAGRVGLSSRTQWQPFVWWAATACFYCESVS